MAQDQVCNVDVNRHGHYFISEFCNDEVQTFIQHTVFMAVNEVIERDGSVPNDFWQTFDWKDIKSRGVEVANNALSNQASFNPLTDQMVSSDFNPLLSPPPTPSDRQGTLIQIPWGTILVLAVAVGLVVFAKTPGATQKVQSEIRKLIDKCMKIKSNGNASRHNP
jgi:hypothetical protein